MPLKEHFLGAGPGDKHFIFIINPHNKPMRQILVTPCYMGGNVY